MSLQDGAYSSWVTAPLVMSSAFGVHNGRGVGNCQAGACDAEALEQWARQQQELLDCRSPLVQPHDRRSIGDHS